jgi:hypothetical protein
MIVRQNSKLDRILWRVGLSWWQRMRYKLWLHFLPYRIICLFRGHRWKEPWPIIDDGPIHLPPRDRYWRMLGLKSSCARCADSKNVPYTPEQEVAWIEEYTVDSEEEWADPEIRAALERLGPIPKDS